MKLTLSTHISKHIDRKKRLLATRGKKSLARTLKSMTLILEQELNITQELDKPFTE